MSTTGLPALGAASSAADLPTLRAASSGEHLWIAAPRPAPSPEVAILHAAGGAVRDCGSVDALPDALVADGSRVWILMPPSPDAGSAPVYSLRATFNPISSRWFSEPIGRFEVLPSVPGTAPLAGAAASDGTLVTLQGGDAPSLRELLGSAWTPAAMPPGLPSGMMLHAWPGASGPGWALVARDGADLRAWTRSPADANGAGTWAAATLPGSGEGLVLVVTGASRPTVLRRAAPAGDRGAPEWALAYARADGPLEIARIATPGQPWTVVGTGDAFSLVTVSEPGSVSVSPIDSVDGRVGAPMTLADAPSAAGEWLHLPIIGGLTIAALLAGFLLRPPVGDRAPALPAGWDPMDSWKRVLALAMDMVPGAGVALIATGCPVPDLLAMPAWTASTARTLPSALMIAVTIAWCAAWEVAIGSTPGKLALGRGRIVRVDRLSPSEIAARAAAGVPEWPAPAASRGRRLARALVKGVVLFAPALAFLAFVHPLQMGLPDVLTDTAVARRRR